MGNYAQKTPFNSDCVKAAGYDFTNAVLNTDKVTVMDKAGYYCDPNNQYGNNKAIYTLEELKSIVSGRGQYDGTWPLDGCVWDATSSSWNLSNASVNENAPAVVVGDVYYAPWPGPYTGNEEGLQALVVNNNLKDNGPYTNCYFDAHLDFTNATINTTDKTRQYGVEVATGNYYVEYGGYEGPNLFTDRAAVEAYIRENDLQENHAFTNCYVAASVDFTNATVDETQAPLQFCPIDPIDITYLNNVEKKAAQPWTLDQGYNLYGPFGFFEEQVCYYGGNAGGTHHTGQEKPTLPGYDLDKIEAGFKITSTGKGNGEIAVPFIYGATQIQDQFGYVYYKDGQDPLTQPHYILMKDGRPQSNIYFDGWTTENGGTAVECMQLSGWSNNPQLYKGKNAEVYGTEYKLSFFGDDHSWTEGSYYFPAGYHIVFFICPGALEGMNTETGVCESYRIDDFNYSDPDLNLRIQHYNANGTTPRASSSASAARRAAAEEGAVTPYPEGTVDPNAGARKATAWVYNGQVYMGFEDGGHDEDLNDIVFWVEGEYVTGDLIESYDLKNSTTLSWIFACEDLGGDFDYDFNDVVWEVSQDVTVTTQKQTVNGNVTTTGISYAFADIKVSLLANGGTLPVSLLYDGTPVSANGKTELHEILSGQTINTETNLYKAVNALAKKDGQLIDANMEGKDPVVVLTIPSNNEIIDINTITAKFKIQATGNDGTSYFVTAPEKTNSAPQIIVLPGEWEWPTEHTSIETAYPDFKEWVRTATWTQWSENKVEGKTVPRTTPATE